jgi:hypothetical protein
LSCSRLTPRSRAPILSPASPRSSSLWNISIYMTSLSKNYNIKKEQPTNASKCGLESGAEADDLDLVSFVGDTTFGLFQCKRYLKCAREYESYTTGCNCATTRDREDICRPASAKCGRRKSMSANPLWVGGRAFRDRLITT